MESLCRQQRMLDDLWASTRCDGAYVARRNTLLGGRDPMEVGSTGCGSEEELETRLWVGYTTMVERDAESACVLLSRLKRDVAGLLMPTHPICCRTNAFLTVALVHSGYCTETVRVMADRNLRWAVKACGEQGPVHADACFAVAVAAEGSKCLGEAASLMQYVVKEREANYPKNHPLVLEAKVKLAVLQHQQQKSLVSNTLFHDCIQELWRLDRGSPILQAALQSCAFFELQFHKNLPQALKMLVNAQDLAIQYFGEGSHLHISADSFLGSVNMVTGQFSEAEVIFKHVLRMQLQAAGVPAEEGLDSLCQEGGGTEEARGVGSPETAPSCVLAEEGVEDSAEEGCEDEEAQEKATLRRTAALRRRNVQRTRLHLAQVIGQQAGRKAEAEALYKDILSVSESPFWASFEDDLISVLKREEDLARGGVATLEGESSHSSSGVSGSSKTPQQVQETASAGGTGCSSCQVDHLEPMVSKQAWWKTLLLFLLPVVLGVLLVFAQGVFRPSGVDQWLPPPSDGASPPMPPTQDPNRP